MNWLPDWCSVLHENLDAAAKLREHALVRGCQTVQACIETYNARDQT